MEMTLNLPRNYVEIEEDEMVYVDGGWSSKQVLKNAIAMTAIGYIGWIGSALKNFVRANPNLGFWSTVGKIGVTAAKAFWAMPWWAKILNFAAGACVIYSLGTWDIF